MASFEPVVLIFVLAFGAAFLKTDLKIPDTFYYTLHIYLLLSIGIKSVIELYHAPSLMLLPAIGTILPGISVTLFAFFLLMKIGSARKTNALSIAARYGSVSAVTFAVVGTYLRNLKIGYESYMTVLLVLLEIPLLAMATGISKWQRKKEGNTNFVSLTTKVLLGKSILLLIGCIGWYTTWCKSNQLNFFFFDLFKGFLVLFLLAMGIVAASRLGELKKAGTFLVAFGILMPTISASPGSLSGKASRLSQGGSIVLANMQAMASYIASAAAIKLSLPNANRSLSMTAAAGTTFPFNVIAGIARYTKLSPLLYT